MTVRQNNRGKWSVDIDFEHPDGRKERIRKTSPVQTRRGAEAYEREIRQALLSGTYGKAKEEETPVPTLEEYREEFLDWSRSERHKASGVESKESVLRCHLVPLFGKRRLDSFTAVDQKALRKLFKGKAASTYNNSATVLNKLLEIAKEEKRIKEVPFKFKLLPRVDKKPPFYDFDQYEWLVGAGVKIDSRTEVAVLLGGDAGLRRGEMFALTWAMVDLRRGLITVEEAEVVIRGERSLDDTKGRNSRVIPMTKRLLEALKTHRHLRSDRVLCTDEGEPMTNRIFRNMLIKAQKRAQLPHRGNVHILRHTFCSHLAMRGAPVLSIKNLAGHRELSTTMKYMHLSPGETHRAIALLDDRSSHLSSTEGWRANGNLTATQ